MVGPARSEVEARFARLRKKLDDGGYLESFGVDSLRLVDHLFKDLKGTTESLQKTLLEYAQYKKIAEELESGVAPFKEENVRLYKENSQLRMNAARVLEDAEDKAREPLSRVRELEAENSDLKLLVSQFAERLKKAEIDALEKSSRLVKLQEKSLGLGVAVGEKEKKKDPSMSQCKQSMEIGYFLPDACPQCVRLRNYVEYGKNSDRNPGTVDYVKMADSRIEALQLQLRSFKNLEKEHMALIASLKGKINTRDAEIDKLRDLIKVRPGRDNKVNGYSLPMNGDMEKNLEAELKSAEMQLQMVQRRNLELEEKLKRSILQEHEDYMLGKFSTHFGDRNLAKICLEKELDKIPSHDKMSLLEKLYHLERQLSHCCKEKAMLQKQVEKCHQNHSSSTSQNFPTREHNLLDKPGNAKLKGKPGSRSRSPHRPFAKKPESSTRFRIGQSQSIHSVKRMDTSGVTKSSSGASTRKFIHKSTAPSRAASKGKGRNEAFTQEVFDGSSEGEDQKSSSDSRAANAEGADSNSEEMNHVGVVANRNGRNVRSRAHFEERFNEEFSEVEEENYVSEDEEGQLRSKSKGTEKISTQRMSTSQPKQGEAGARNGHGQIKVKTGAASRFPTRQAAPTSQSQNIGKSGTVKQQNAISNKKATPHDLNVGEEDVNNSGGEYSSGSEEEYNANKVPEDDDNGDMYCDDNGNVRAETRDRDQPTTSALRDNLKTENKALQPWSIRTVRTKLMDKRDQKVGAAPPGGGDSRSISSTVPSQKTQALKGDRKLRQEKLPARHRKDSVSEKGQGGFAKKTALKTGQTSEPRRRNQPQNVGKQKQQRPVGARTDGTSRKATDVIEDDMRDEVNDEFDEAFVGKDYRSQEHEQMEELDEEDDYEQEQNVRDRDRVAIERTGQGPGAGRLVQPLTKESIRGQEKSKASRSRSGDGPNANLQAQGQRRNQASFPPMPKDTRALQSQASKSESHVRSVDSKNGKPILASQGSREDYEVDRNVLESTGYYDDEEEEEQSDSGNGASYSQSQPSHSQSAQKILKGDSRSQSQEYPDSRNLNVQRRSQDDFGNGRKDRSHALEDTSQRQSSVENARDLGMRRGEQQKKAGSDEPSAPMELRRAETQPSKSSVTSSNISRSRGITHVEEPSLLSVSELEYSDFDRAIDSRMQKSSQDEPNRGSGYNVQTATGSSSKHEVGPHVPFDHGDGQNPRNMPFQSSPMVGQGQIPRGLEPIGEREFNRGVGGDAAASFGEMSVSEASFSRRGDREGQPPPRRRGPFDSAFDERSTGSRNQNYPPPPDPYSRARGKNGSQTYRTVGVNTDGEQTGFSNAERWDDMQEKRVLNEKCAVLQRKLDDVHQESSRHQLKSFELQGELERTKHMLQIEKQERELANTELKRLREMNNESTARLLMNSAMGSDGSFRRGTTPMEMEREIMNLRGALSSLDRDKDEMRVELDRKDEKLARVMSDAQRYMDEISQLKLRLKNAELQISHTGESAKEQSREADFLKKQLESNRRDLDRTIKERDDALRELHKITSAHSKGQLERRSVETELELKHKETDDLRKQVQRYIDEVRRIEELLLDKEEELETLLQHYKALTAENNNLEAQRTSLEREAYSIRESVKDAVDQNITFKNQLASQNALVQSLEEEIQRFTQQIAHLENQLESKIEKEKMLEADVKASKDLIYRLEVQMDKLKLDLADSDSKRKQLEAENSELNSHIAGLEARLQDETERQKQMENLIANSREKDFKLERTAQDISRERDELAEKLTSLQQRSETLNSEVSRYRLKSIELQSELDRTRRQLDGEKRERDTTMSELRKLREQLHSSSANKLLSAALGTTGSSSGSRIGGMDSSPLQGSSAGSTYRQNLLAEIPEMRGSREQSPFESGLMGALGDDSARSRDTPLATSTSRQETVDTIEQAGASSSGNQAQAKPNVAAEDDEFEAWDSPNK